MIDTVIITIKQGAFRVIDCEKFGISRIEFESWTQRRFGHDSLKNNPTAEDKEQGIYKPRLTLYRRPSHEGTRLSLKVEFSAPKIIFNNNLEELEEHDFPKVVEATRKRMFEMGVLTTDQAIEEAEISAFHPAKNIPLLEGYSASLAIKELWKVDLPRYYDLARIIFRNGGLQVQFYTNSHSLVFYDKISDLNQSKGRAWDKDQTNKQFALFEDIKNSKSNLEVLKMEVRLSKKGKVKTLLPTLGYPANPLFRDVFKKDLCQKILKYYWNEFVADKNLFLFDMNNNPQNILKTIFQSDNVIKAKKAIYLTGLNLLAKDEGICDLRSILEAYRSNYSWPRIQRDFKVFRNGFFIKNQYGFIKDIANSLNKFEPFRL